MNSPAVTDEASELNYAIDALAAVLGAMSNAASSDTGTARLEAWQRHVLVLEPPPGPSSQLQPTRRAWGGARGAALGWIR